MKSKASLFRDFPLDGDIKLGGEILTTPYHIYDGNLLSIGGTVELCAAKDLLAREYFTPLTDEKGRALAIFWIGDFTEANLGPHHELQFSLLATATSGLKIPSGQYSIFHALAARTETKMVCHGLWNNTKRVVHYNSEHLLLNADYMQSTITNADGRVEFRFHNSSGNNLLGGNIQIAQFQLLRPLWNMVRQVGLRGIINTLRSDYIEVPVVSTRSAAVRENLVSRTYSRSNSQILAPFSKDDRIEIGHPPYANLDFKPDFIQMSRGIGFVYLRPQPIGSSEVVGQ